MTIDDLVHTVHAMAKDKGWYETKRSPLEAHMLMVSELSEATEEVRKGYPPMYIEAGDKKVTNPAEFDGAKPEGEAIELADAVIRIADYFGYRGWSLEEAIRLKVDYNKNRSYRHGGKKY